MEKLEPGRGGDHVGGGVMTCGGRWQAGGDVRGLGVGKKEGRQHSSGREARAGGARASGGYGELIGANGVEGGRPRLSGDVGHERCDEVLVTAALRGGRRGVSGRER